MESYYQKYIGRNAAALLAQAKGTRPCSPSELYKPNTARIFQKMFLDAILLVLLSAFFHAESQRQTGDFPKLILGCGTGERTLVTVAGADIEFADDGRSYCLVKFLVLCIGGGSLLILLINSLSQILVLYSIMVASDLKVAIADDIFAWYPKGATASNGYCDVFIFSMCSICLQGCFAHESSGEVCGCSGWPSWLKKVLVFIICSPSVALAVATPVAGGLILINETGLENLIVDFIGVQLLTTWSNEMLKGTFYPRLAAGELLKSYVQESEGPGKPGYWPFEAHQVDTVEERAIFGFGREEDEAVSKLM